MNATDQSGAPPVAAKRAQKTSVTKLEDSLSAVSGLSIHRGSINTNLSAGVFEIEVGFPFSNALVQLIPITTGGGPCTLNSVRSTPSGASKLKVNYQVSDPSKLAQVAFIVFVTS